MEIKTITLTNKTTNMYIDIGRVGENNVTQIKIDFSLWIEQYGNGTCQIVCQPPHSDFYYPVSNSNTEGNFIVWTITSSDTCCAGKGLAEIRYYIEDGLKKSALITYNVQKSISGESGDMPEPSYDLIEKISEKTKEVLIRETADMLSENYIGFVVDDDGSIMIEGYGTNSLSPSQIEQIVNERLGVIENGTY